MEPIAIKLLGFAAATCTTLAYAPQFVKVVRTRSTEDISLGMFLVMVLGIFLWLVYGLLSGDGPLIVANAITIVHEAEIRLRSRMLQLTAGIAAARAAACDRKEPQTMIVALDDPLSERHKGDAVLHLFGNSRIRQNLRIIRQVAQP